MGRLGKAVVTVEFEILEDEAHDLDKMSPTELHEACENMKDVIKETLLEDGWVDARVSLVQLTKI